MTKGSWGASKRSLGQVDHITHDWLTPCEYIPYIDALLRNIPEALFFTTYPEMIRTCPEMWDFPICIPTDRANLIHGKKFECLESPISWGYFVYLPEISMGFNQTERFKNIFSHIGKVVA